MAENMRFVLEGIGCLTTADDGGEGPHKVRSAYFEDQHQLSRLLFFMADAVDTIRGLSVVSSGASFRLLHPDLYGDVVDRPATR